MEEQNIHLRYRLRAEPKYTGVRNVLANRGIEDVDRWISAGWDDIYDWRLFGEGLMGRAVELLRSTIADGLDTVVVVDPDVDGYTSAALFINFIFDLYPDYFEEHLKYVLHDDKTHGLSKITANINENVSLVVIPDAGSSDYCHHQELVGSGAKILILDHHKVPEGANDSPSVVTVNNQLCDYPNKALTGVGVTWQFCRAYEDIVLGDGEHLRSTRLMDLVAIGNISDMSDFRSIETRAIVNVGLSSLNNAFMSALAAQNEYTIEKYGGLTYKGVAFGITPFINAICRSATLEEKELIFSALLDANRYMIVRSGKRGKIGDNVPLAEEAVRVALNVKARQTKEQNSAYDVIQDTVYKGGVASVVADRSLVRPELAGLLANKMQSEYGLPSLVLIDYADEGVYRGSCRNCQPSPVKDFRKLCEDSSIVDYAAGHSSAFGLQIRADRYDSLIEYLDGKVSEASEETDTPTLVDFIWNSRSVPKSVFFEIDASSDMWGQQIEEPKAVIEDIPLSDVGITLLSPDKNPTLKIMLRNDVQLLRFKSSQEEYDRISGLISDARSPGSSRNVYMTVIGSCSINRWNGNEYCQLMIDDYAIEEKWIF